MRHTVWSMGLLGWINGPKHDVGCHDAPLLSREYWKLDRWTSHICKLILAITMESQMLASQVSAGFQPVLAFTPRFYVVPCYLHLVCVLWSQGPTASSSWYET